MRPCEGLYLTLSVSLAGCVALGDARMQTAKRSHFPRVQGTLTYKSAPSLWIRHVGRNQTTLADSSPLSTSLPMVQEVYRHFKFVVEYPPDADAVAGKEYLVVLGIFFFSSTLSLTFSHTRWIHILSLSLYIYIYIYIYVSLFSLLQSLYISFTVRGFANNPSARQLQNAVIHTVITH